MNWIPENISDGWKVTRIGEVTDVIRGGSPRPKGDPRYFGGNIPWIMIADVSKSPGKYISKTRDTVTEAGAKKSRYLKKGTLILSNSGTVCVPKVLAVDGCIHDGFVAFPDLPDELNIFYLYDFFNYIRPKIIDEHKQGVTQVNLNLDIVRNIKLLLPPLNEQKRIVTKIEALQTRSAAVKEELKAIKPLLNQFRQSVLAAAFRGDLTKEWRSQNPNVEPAKVLLERIKKELLQIERKKDNKPLPNPFEINNKWQWVKLSDVCNSITDGDHQAPPKSNYGIPFLVISNISKGKLNFDDIRYVPENYYNKLQENKKPRNGDIVYSVVGSYGIPVLVDTDKEFCFQRHIALLKSSNWLNNSYLLYALKSNFVYRQATSVATGTTQLTVTLTGLRKIKIPLTSLEEQKEIVHRIESLFKLADNIEQQYQQAEIDLQTLNQSILAKAFRGELVPQDPNDEPASVLLERIRAERDKAKPKKSKTEKQQSSRKEDKQLGIPGI